MGVFLRSGSRPCEQCGAQVELPHCRTRFCRVCAYARTEGDGKREARAAVARAVRQGLLAPAKTLTCVDCASTARDYDHRDYSKPLDVQPVCRSCNKVRGPARPVLTLELP